MPRLPAEDRTESRQLTVATLADDCAEFAELDKDFREIKIVQFGVGYKRVLNNLMNIEIDFTATHTTDEGMYDGVVYTLGFKTAQRIEYLTDDLIKLAEEQAIELPKNEDICFVRFAHVAEFTIDQVISLESDIHEYYEVHSHTDTDDEGIIDSEEDISDDTFAEDDEPEEGHRRPIILPSIITHHQSEDTESNAEVANPDDKLFADMVTDMYLRQAYDIFNVFKSNNKHKLDISEIFPTEFLKATGNFPTE